jgi:hypothetical protein
MHIVLRKSRHTNAEEALRRARVRHAALRLSLAEAKARRDTAVIELLAYEVHRAGEMLSLLKARQGRLRNKLAPAPPSNDLQDNCSGSSHLRSGVKPES